MKRLILPLLILICFLIAFSSCSSQVPATTPSSSPTPEPAPASATTPSPSPNPEPTPAPAPAPTPEPAPAPVPVSPPTPAQAEFEVSSLVISPLGVVAGEIAIVKADVANIGGMGGVYSVVLRVNGVVEGTKEIELPAGVTETVSFEFVRDIAGIYEIEIDGIGQSLTVQELATAQPEYLGQNEYTMEQQITLTNEGPNTASRITLTIALISTMAPYQIVTFVDIGQHGYETIVDEYGNKFAIFEFHDVDVGDTVRVGITYNALVNELRYELGPCSDSGGLPTKFLQPEQWMESDSIEVLELADYIAGDMADPCDKARAFYDWIGDNIAYSGHCTEDRGALFALHTGEGDCSEYAELYIALCRAAGVPARFIHGITPQAPGEGTTSLHGWAEVYLPGTGWVPVDPTWGRYKERREQYFAAITPDHMVVSKGRNLKTLEGESHYFSYHYWWKGQRTYVSSDQKWYIQRVNVPKPESLLASDDDYQRLRAVFDTWGMDFNYLYDFYSEKGFANDWGSFWIGSDDDENRRVYFDRVGNQWKPRAIPNVP